MSADRLLRLVLPLSLEGARGAWQGVRQRPAGADRSYAALAGIIDQLRTEPIPDDPVGALANHALRHGCLTGVGGLPVVLAGEVGLQLLLLRASTWCALTRDREVSTDAIIALHLAALGVAPSWEAAAAQLHANPRLRSVLGPWARGLALPDSENPLQLLRWVWRRRRQVAAMTERVAIRKGRLARFIPLVGIALNGHSTRSDLLDHVQRLRQLSVQTPVPNPALGVSSSHVR